MSRERKVAQSVVQAFTEDDEHEAQSAFSRTLAAITAFFHVYHLRFVRFRNSLFYGLRNQTWDIDEDDYRWSFGSNEALKPMGDMGYSGSVSFSPPSYSSTRQGTK